MRPHGRADINQNNPRALGVCDRCGGLYNHHRLGWQSDWRGVQLQNLRVLVCDDCRDQYQQSGQRTIILPADPEPIMNARPEAYVAANNPLSVIGANPNNAVWQYGSRIGTMTNAAGVPAAFDGNANKPSFLSAMTVTPASSFDNYVGINWSGYFPGTLPSSLESPVITHAVSSYKITGPNDSIIGSSGYVVQGSNIAGGFATWTTLASGSITGTVGEVLSGLTLSAKFQFTRAAFFGGTTPIAVAQVSFSVSDGGSV